MKIHKKVSSTSIDVPEDFSNLEDSFEYFTAEDTFTDSSQKSINTKTTSLDYHASLFPIELSLQKQTKFQQFNDKKIAQKTEIKSKTEKTNENSAADHISLSQPDFSTISEIFHIDSNPPILPHIHHSNDSFFLSKVTEFNFAKYQVKDLSLKYQHDLNRILKNEKNHAETTHATNQILPFPLLKNSSNYFAQTASILPTVTKESVCFPCYRDSQTINSMHFKKKKNNKKEMKKFKELFNPIKDLFSTPSSLLKDTDDLNVEFFPLTEVNKITIIGVHGWFPPKWTEFLTKRTSGTSKILTSNCNRVIRDFYIHNYDHYLDAEAIVEIPLTYGLTSGKVGERVAFHYDTLKLSDTFSKAINESEVVIFAAHSQGVPVATILIEKMLENDNFFVNFNKKKIGLLAIAGVCHGPFPIIEELIPLKESVAAKELFHFCDSNSKSYKQFESALKSNMGSCPGMRISTVSAWNDEAVPLYSSSMFAITHHNIFRTIHVKAVDYKDDFLTNLINYCLMLKNYGFSDHNLTIQLSEQIAGSVFGKGKAHSSCYEDLKAYHGAISFILAPQNLNQVNGSESNIINQNDFFKIEKQSLKLKKYNAHNFQEINDYDLPFIFGRLMMEGITNKDIKSIPELQNSLLTLVNSFDAWNPESKLLKEFKFRLNGMNSKSFKSHFKILEDTNNLGKGVNSVLTMENATIKVGSNMNVGKSLTADDNVDNDYEIGLKKKHINRWKSKLAVLFGNS